MMVVRLRCVLVDEEEGMHGLGPLEAAIMDQVWSSGSALSVRTVYDRLANDRKIAYTTVMTVMDNLHGKGFLIRELMGRAYVYSPTRSREEYAASLLDDVLAQSGDRTGALMHFVDGLGDEEIDELRSMVDRARRGEAPPGRHP